MTKKLAMAILAWAMFLAVLGGIGWAVWRTLDEHVTFSPPWDVERVTIDGHLYFKMRQRAIVHAESCPCKQATNR